MSFATKHAKAGIKWGIDSKDFEYISCKDLFEMGHTAEDSAVTLRGCFINSNKDPKQLKEFGPSVVGILDNKLVNFPSHMLDEIQGILEDQEDIEAIKSGTVGFYVDTYESHGKTCYGVNWVDLL